ELKGPGNDAAGRPREPERLGLVQRLAVDGVTGGEPHPPGGPRRFGIPLVGDVPPDDAARLARRRELEPGRALDVLGDGPGQEVRDVDLTLLEGRGPRRLP